MPTTLKDELVRETGIEKNGLPVYVSLIPDDNGGKIALRAKNQRDYLVQVPIVSLLKHVHAPEIESPAERPHGVVDLADLETKLMIQAPEFMDETVKAKLWRLIRDIQESLNEEAGLPCVSLAMKA